MPDRRTVKNWDNVFWGVFAKVGMRRVSEGSWTFRSREPPLAEQKPFRDILGDRIKEHHRQEKVEKVKKVILARKQARKRVKRDGGDHHARPDMTKEGAPEAPEGAPEGPEGAPEGTGTNKRRRSRWG